MFCDPGHNDEMQDKEDATHVLRDKFGPTISAGSRNRMEESKVFPEPSRLWKCPAVRWDSCSSGGPVALVCVLVSAVFKSVCERSKAGVAVSQFPTRNSIGSRGPIGSRAATVAAIAPEVPRQRPRRQDGG